MTSRAHTRDAPSLSLAPGAGRPPRRRVELLLVVLAVVVATAAGAAGAPSVAAGLGVLAEALAGLVSDVFMPPI